MVVETVQLESGRSVNDLASALEATGGSLIVLSGWGATVANVYLPEDDRRQAVCRRVIEEWRSGALVPQSPGGWPPGHPRRPTQRS